MIIMKIVLGFVGMPGVGKSSALEVGKEFGTIVVMGDVIREETKKRGLKINSDSLGMIAKKLREEEGQDVISKRTIKKIENINHGVIIVDGIRSMNEVKLFRKYFNLKIIAITAPDEKRHQWIIDRGRKDDSKSKSKIIARDKREIDFGIYEVINNANYEIKNLDTRKNLKENTIIIIKKAISDD